MEPKNIRNISRKIAINQKKSKKMESQKNDPFLRLSLSEAKSICLKQCSNVFDRNFAIGMNIHKVGFMAHNFKTGKLKLISPYGKALKKHRIKYGCTVYVYRNKDFKIFVFCNADGLIIDEIHNFKPLEKMGKKEHPVFIQADDWYAFKGKKFDNSNTFWITENRKVLR